MNHALIAQVAGYGTAIALIAWAVALAVLAGCMKSWPRYRRADMATIAVVLWLGGAVFALATTLIAESLR